jgi:hypothetical protein
MYGFPPNLKNYGNTGKISPSTIANEMEFGGPPVFLFLFPSFSARKDEI